MAGKHRALSPRQARRERVETSDYVAFLIRAIGALSLRIGDDPVALVHCPDLTAALTRAVNHGIWLAGQGQNAYSQNDMARILGVSRQAIQQRQHKGEEIHAEEIERRGGGGVVRLGEIRRDRARLIEAAGLPDRTGSDRERAIKAVGQ